MGGKTRTVIVNSALQTGTQVVTWALSWILLVILPRRLGDENFGTLFFAISYGTIFATCINLGINSFLLKQVAILRPSDDTPVPEELRELVGGIVTLKLTLAVLTYAIQSILIFILPYDALTQQTVLIIGAATCIGSLTLTAGSVFQGMEKLWIPNAALIAEKAVTTLVCTVLLLRGASLLPVCWVYLVAAAVSLVLVALPLARTIPMRLRLTRPLLRTIMIGGLPFLIWVIFGEIYVRIDVLMLSLMTSAAVVGWYGAAFRLYSTLLFVPHTLNTVVFPALIRMGAKDDDDAAFSRATERLMILLLAAAMPIGVGTAIIAPHILRLLYGEGPFANSGPCLQIFSASIVLVCIDVMLGSVLIARHREKMWSLMAVAAAAFNPLMNAWMIPLTQRLYGNGGIGAATATLLTELLMMIGAICLLPRGILGRRTIITAVKAAAVSLAMGALIVALKLENVFAIIAVGGLFYTIVALATGVIPFTIIAHIRHAIFKEGRET